MRPVAAGAESLVFCGDAPDGPNFRHDGGFAYDLALSFLTPLTLFGLLKSREFLGSDFRAIEVPREGVPRTSPATPITARDPGKLPILTNNARQSCPGLVAP